MVYLDYNNATPVDKRILEVMTPLFTEQFADPTGVHKASQKVKQLVDDARVQVAQSIGMNPDDVVFMPDRKAANTYMVQSIITAQSKMPAMVYGITEHNSIKRMVGTLEENDVSCDVAPANSLGMIDTEKFAQVVDDSYLMVSVSMANDVTGIINPIKKLAKIAHEHDVLVHCDATQAFGKIPFSAEMLGVDMMTIASDIIYGPRGCAALVANAEAREYLAIPDKTSNVPGIVGFGRACEIALREGLLDMPRQLAIRNDFERELSSHIEDLMIFGQNSDRLANTSCMAVDGVMAPALALNTPDVDFSYETAQPKEPFDESHTITSMGYTPKIAGESFTISIGRQTRTDDMDQALEYFVKGMEYVLEKSDPKNRIWY